MSVSASEGSALLVKRDCKYLCEASRPITTPPTTEDWAQHPALNLAMDGIATYANWVSRVVMPIAFQWIHEKETLICKNEGWDELPDDVNEVVQAAFALVQNEKYYKDCNHAFDKFLRRMKHDPLKPEETHKINKSWTEVSARLRKEVMEELDWEPEPAHK